jgi:dTDP-glucose 4,6-dehydratase
VKVLVTGGCGFIGSHFIKLLLDKRPDARVTNMDRLTYAGNEANVDALKENPRYKFIHGDIASPVGIEAAMENRPDVIVNFAAESHVDRSLEGPVEFVRTNLEGTVCLLEAARRRQVKRFVQISTDEVYGSCENGLPFEEGDPLHPNNPYSVTKAAADQMVLAYARSFRMDVVITRSTNNYGPCQYPEKFIPVIITKALEEKPIPIYGDGLQVRDWLHVRDNCAGILAVLEKGAPGEIYNLAGRSERANIEVVRLVLSILEKPETLISFVKDRPGHDRHYCVGWRKAAWKLDWEAKIPFAEGLRETVEWYKKRWAPCAK